MCPMCRTDVTQLGDAYALQSSDNPLTSIYQSHLDTVSSVGSENRQTSPNNVAIDSKCRSADGRSVKVVILLDFKYTLLYCDDESNVEMRPHAAELLDWLRDQQRFGTCQIGFYSASSTATTLALHVLNATRAQLPEDTCCEKGISAGKFEVMDGPWQHESVWLFDEHYTEITSEYQHEPSGTYMHVKSLEKVMDVLMLERGMLEPTTYTVYVTCSPHCVAGALQDNVVEVDAWWPPELKWPGDWQPPQDDSELVRLREYLEELLAAAQEPTFEMSNYVKSTRGHSRGM